MKFLSYIIKNTKHFNEDESQSCAHASYKHKKTKTVIINFDFHMKISKILKI